MIEWNLGVSSRRRASNIGFVGTYIPQRCGIATFGADLVAAIAAEDCASRMNVVAVSDRPDTNAYPKEVKFEVSRNVLGQYEKAADSLNAS
ncbi:MAG: glycosyl transferase family 1, partial [Gammaproteobacteria bacterium]|nr:glycosyl transferase family 1 [Gammaproteobacteria bacterium]